MISPRQIHRLIATAASVAVLAMLPSSLAAQENNPNTTGIPLYAKVSTGSEYQSVKEDSGHYKVYTAQSSDPIATVEAWYRKALPKAVETKDDNQLTKGIVLTAGQDKVLIYNLGGGKATVIELQKYVSP